MEWPPFNGELAACAGNLPVSSFRSKFLNLPYYIGLWAERVGGLAGKRVLDFGCGYGETALGVAVFHLPNEIIGVDINDESQLLRNIIPSELVKLEKPDTLLFYRI